MSSNARSRRLPPARINHRNSPPRSTTSTSFNPDWWYRRIALRITESGRSVLRALEGLREPSLDFPSGSASHSLKLIDNLIGTEERLKIFNLEIRAMNEGVDFGAVQDEEDLKPTMPESPAPAPEIGVDDPPEDMPPQSPQKTDHTDLESTATIETDPTEAEPKDAPSFLLRGFGSGAEVSAQAPARHSRLFSSTPRTSDTCAASGVTICSRIYRTPGAEPAMRKAAYWRSLAFF